MYVAFMLSLPLFSCFLALHPYIFLIFLNFFFIFLYMKYSRIYKFCNLPICISTYHLGLGGRNPQTAIAFGGQDGSFPPSSHGKDSLLPSRPGLKEGENGVLHSYNCLVFLSQLESSTRKCDYPIVGITEPCIYIFH